MGVPAKSNEFGTKNYTEPHVIETITYWKDGSVTKSQDAVNNASHTCVRNGKSSVKVLPIQGTTSTFRSPSTYDRGVRNHTYTSGVHQLIITNPDDLRERVEVVGEPNCLAALTQYRIPPVFDGSAYVVTDTNLRNQADTECLNKLADEKAQLGAAIATAKQAVNMFADRVSPYLRALWHARNGRWSSAAVAMGLRDKRRAKQLANGILEFQYGWKPLMQDAYGALKLLQQEFPKDAMLLKAVREVSDFGRVDGSPYNSRFYSEGEAQRWHKTKLWGKLDDFYARQVQQAGLENPLTIGWEIVPFSFIVDWGLPIGNVLKALTATRGLSFVGGYRSVRGTGKVTATLIPGVGYVEVSPAECSVEYYSYRRVKLTTWPKPAVYAKSPFSTGRALNALALFTSAVMR